MKRLLLLFVLLVGCTPTEQPLDHTPEPVLPEPFIGPPQAPKCQYLDCRAYPNKSPRGHILQDAQYCTTSFEHFHDCMFKAKTKMLQNNWRKYYKDILDCEDYAYRLVAGIKYEYATGYKTFNKGIEVGACRFNTDDGGGHAIIFVVIEGKRLYYEPYPWAECVPRTMSPAELATIQTLYF